MYTCICAMVERDPKAGTDVELCIHICIRIYLWVEMDQKDKNEEKYMLIYMSVCVHRGRNGSRRQF